MDIKREELETPLLKERTGKLKMCIKTEDQEINEIINFALPRPTIKYLISALVVHIWTEYPGYPIDQVTIKALQDYNFEITKETRNTIFAVCKRDWSSFSSPSSSEDLY